jgi:hypothetical protein
MSINCNVAHRLSTLQRSALDFRHQFQEVLFAVQQKHPTRGIMYSSSSVTLLLSMLAALEGFRTVHAHDDNNIASMLQEVVNEQQPISNNSVHPMKQSRKWGTVTPKLGSASDARKRHDRRVS